MSHPSMRGAEVRPHSSAARWLAWFGFALVAACAGPSEERQVPAGPLAGAPATDLGIVTAVPVCAVDNPFCQQPPMAPTATGQPMLVPVQTDCGAVALDVRPAGVNIMIAVDGAVSMAEHWTELQTAVRSLRENNPTASFGVHLFWGDAVDPLTDTSTMNTTNNGCSAINAKQLELGTYTSQDLVSFLGSGPPGGVIFNVYQVSPVIEPLNHYLTHATKLADPTRTNYLIVFTGGNDNCFGSAFVSTSQKLIAHQKLALELSKRNIRVIPVGLDAPKATTPMPAGGLFGPPPMNPIGTSTNGMALPTDYEVLTTLLKYGGSGLTEVPRIDTPEKLKELISKVGQTVNSCRFELPASLDSSAAVNPFELTFGINGKTVPRDRHQMNGWDFVGGSTSAVEFFGQGCEAMQSGQTLQAKKSCEQNICGTAAVNVETKPRVVQLLLDSSASRIECTDGSLDCLSTPGTAGRPLTFWETVQDAVGKALMAPVNDDVSFGMQFFPFKNAAALSCDVAPTADIPPASSQQISIMRQMLEKLPFGLSPVVAVMESVAAAPGKLADPGVIGAVVLLSDGGDNCSGDTQAQIVTRLGTAAKKLADAGVKTYAIRYGSADGETPEQAAQLNALVTNGGTAVMGASVQYLDAKNAMQLSDALAAISDKLATCSFTLSAVNTQVDKSRTNLFLNGEQIGFDSKGMKQAGWNWVDAGRTTVELYGEACSTFKTSRRSRVQVEFGCEPVVIDGPQ
jgi:hypothetical protein